MRDKLTKSDIKKMEEEIRYRKLTLRPKLIEEVKTARAQGDLSENFEYYAAKRENNRNNSRIGYLERMVKTAQIIDDSSAEDEAGIDNTVTLLFEDDGTCEKYRLVTNVRSDSLDGRMSIESPLGKAILGKKLGERVKVKVNDSVSYYVVIKEIDNSTDDSEDEINSY